VETGRALRRKWRQLVGKVGEWYVANWHLQGGRPRLCWLRNVGLAPHKQVLNVPIACRWYGPDKPSSRMSIEAWLFPTAPWAVVGKKLGIDPRIDQSSCCGLCWEPFFSSAVDLFKSVDDHTKGCYVWTAWDMYGHRPYADWAWKACDMLVRFFPAGCTSIRITTTLVYE
jgi:hypothetical protein